MPTRRLPSPCDFTTVSTSPTRTCSSSTSVDDVLGLACRSVTVLADQRPHPSSSLHGSGLAEVPPAGAGPAPMLDGTARCRKRLDGHRLSTRQIVEMLVEESGVDLAASKCGVIEDAHQERDVRSYSKYRKCPQRRRRTVDRGGSSVRRGDQLREQRIVVDADRVAFDDAGIDSNARCGRLPVEQQAARLRQESVRGDLRHTRGIRSHVLSGTAVPASMGAAGLRQPPAAPARGRRRRPAR